MVARVSIACLAVVLLLAMSSVFAKTDLSTLPADPRPELAKKVNDSKVDLITAIQSAQKEAQGKAATASMKVVDGKLEISVDVVVIPTPTIPEGTMKRIKVDAETGKITGTEDISDPRFPGEPIKGEQKKTPSGLMYYDLVEGTGETPPDASSRVRVHYTGWLTTGKKFDSSVDRGQPAEFGLNQVIPGWTEGVGSMKVGGKRKLIIPYELAYGPEGRGPIPAKAMLIFDVELLDIIK